MFERFTERARRVVFFARYEASNHGSPYIDTGHLLLALLREDRALQKWFPERGNLELEIRAEIEKRISRDRPFAASIEIPLSAEGKKVLLLAVESAEKLGHATIESEHILLGILRIESSWVARILIARGVRATLVQGQIRAGQRGANQSTDSTEGRLTLERFLAGLKTRNPEELNSFFAVNSRFIDVLGRQWDHDDICETFETLFAPYAKRNASYIVEDTLDEANDLLVVVVLWRNALLASELCVWMHRMTIVLIPEAGSWKILLAQVTPVQPPSHAPK